MDYKNIEKRLIAAHTLFQSKEINKATLDSLQTLLKGIHPKLDALLASVSKAGKQVFQLQQGDIIELSLESFPETTEQEKKRKKIIFLFLKFWNDLKSEVARVQKELNSDKETKIQNKGNAWGNILRLAKGPLGIITVVAAIIAIAKVTEISIVIRNNGCEPLTPVSSVAIQIPGLQIPAAAISNGKEAVAKLPPIRISIDATSSTIVRVTVYGVGYNFPVESSGAKFVFDGKLINGEHTRIDLGSQKTHLLEIQCR